MLTLMLCFSLSVPSLVAGGFRDVDQNAGYLIPGYSGQSKPSPRPAGGDEGSDGNGITGKSCIFVFRMCVFMYIAFY